MKHLKMLALAVMATAALMALAAPVSATTLTSPAGTEYTGELNYTATSSLLFEIGFIDVTCTNSTIKGKVESNGGATASGKISTLSFSSCGESTVDTLANGSFAIGSSGGGKGAVTGSGSVVTFAVFGVSCAYKTISFPQMGPVTGGTPATFTLDASVPLESGGILCSKTATWTGSYQVTSPGTLLVD
jgi:hypothetical protein